MRNFKILLTTSFLVLGSIWAVGQTKFMATAVNTSVTGTSTLHDWEMKSPKAECTMTATTDANGNITAISAMKFKVGAKTLKSGKGAMDNNAYKALKADKNPNITADLKSAKVTTKDNVNYTVQATVILTIGGKAKETEMVATLKKINVDSYSINAKKKINMVEYGVEPPSFMMGTVTTGKDVDLSFNFILNK